MNEQRGNVYSIGQFAKLTGVTERTLRYYDKQNLLKPSWRNEHGRRFYKDEDLLQLQKILTLKFLDFSLDEISAHLEDPSINLQQSLDHQYELLRMKQKQIEAVITKLDRIRHIVEGAGTLDNGLLLTLIHSVQHEEEQRQYLSRLMPSTLIDAIYMEGKPDQERFETERIMLAKMVRLTDLGKAGKLPQDPEVVQAGLELVEMMRELIGPIISEMSEEEVERLEILESDESFLDPSIFPQHVAKEDEQFISAVMDYLADKEEGGNLFGR